MLNPKDIIKRNVNALFKNHKASAFKIVGYAAEPELFKRLNRLKIKHKVMDSTSVIDVIIGNKKCQIKIIGNRCQHQVRKHNVCLCMRHRYGTRYKRTDVDEFIFVNVLFPDLPNFFRISGKNIIRLFNQKAKYNSKRDKMHYPSQLGISKEELKKYTWNI